MKSLKINHFWVVGLIISLALFSCSKDDDPIPDNLNLQQIEDNIMSGTWRITKFIDSEKDETNHFSGYNFVFGNNNLLTSTNGTNSYEGTWSITDSNSDDDDSHSDLDFNIYFNLSNDFEDLNDDWDIISQSATKIELFDVSGGDEDTDYLTFEKN